MISTLHNPYQRLVKLMALWLLLPAGLYAQASKDYLKAADKYFGKADFASAALYYEKYLSGQDKQNVNGGPYVVTAAAAAPVAAPGNKLVATYRLAESYRQLTNIARATPLYAEVAAGDSGMFPLAGFYYAAGERALGNYDAAASAFAAFLQKHSLPHEQQVIAERELVNLQFIKAQMAKDDIALYKIKKLAEGKAGASYAPALLAADTVFFTATWQEGSELHTNRLYQAVFSNGSMAPAAPAAIPGANKHQGTASFSDDRKTLFFTAWNIIKGKKSAALYISRRNGNGWSQPVLLDTLVNRPGYQAQQPFLLPGGRYLLFVSDRPGGIGGLDIWCAELDGSGHAVRVFNAGNTINTAGNEQAPYYHAPGNRLVFASDGRTGMGGYDLYYSKGNIGAWQTPVNFGYPVNSVKDDMYFASLSASADPLEMALLSSDRDAECCLELMALQFVRPAVAEPPVAVIVPDTMVKPAAPVFASQVLEHVYYALNSAELQPVSFIVLDQLADTLMKYPDLVVEIGGHTDNTGSYEFNLLLSQRRADNVVAYLVSKGIDKKRVSAKGYGADKPIAPNTHADGRDNPEGREKNRRTELKILK
ncbi:OmpA family protein [Filimonas effusa]|nr:OmpA family protein [Filimonas effusa]